MSTITTTQIFQGVPLQKLQHLIDAGWEINGVSIQRSEEGKTRHGALTLGGKVLWWNQEQLAQQEPSPTAGMNIAQRILHVGGRNNAAGYVEFGSIQAVEALVRQVLRDQPPQPLTEREVELLDGMIEVQLDHAMRCDAIGNRTMAQKQKSWDMERVELLRKLKTAHGITKGGAA